MAHGSLNYDPLAGWSAPQVTSMIERTKSFIAQRLATAAAAD